MTFSVSRDVEWSEEIVEIFLYAIRYYDYCHYFYCTTILLRRMDALFSEIPAQPMISHSQSTGGWIELYEHFQEYIDLSVPIIVPKIDP